MNTERCLKCDRAECLTITEKFVSKSTTEYEQAIDWYQYRQRVQYDCNKHAVNWRDRAIAAEKERDEANAAVKYSQDVIQTAVDGENRAVAALATARRDAIAEAAVELRKIAAAYPDKPGTEWKRDRARFEQAADIVEALTPPAPSEAPAMKCFQRGDDPANETCLDCGQHISRHYGGTFYRCEPCTHEGGHLPGCNDARHASPPPPSVDTAAWVGSPLHVAIWDAINAYAVACGGHATRGGVPRMKAVVAVERELDKLMAEDQ